MAIIYQGVATWQAVCQYWHMPTGKSQLPGPISTEVAEIISTAIADAGKSQAEVSRAASMSSAQLSRVLSGKKIFTLEEFDRVCMALGLDLVKVIGDADDASRARRTALADVLEFKPKNVGGGAETSRMQEEKAVAFDAEKLDRETDEGYE